MKTLRIAEDRKFEMVITVGKVINRMMWLALLFILTSFAGNARAQYFSLKTQDQHASIIDADGLDSILFVAATPFALPHTNDSIGLTYHEPMPDSIMPRSAIVVGVVTVQNEDPDVLVNKLEKFARKSGADWIVSFAEPRVFHDKKGNRLFRASATLLHVLDPMFMNQNDISYSYFETNNLHNYAEVSNWFDSFGRHMGARIDKSE
jgi:hypothetical protein